MWALRVATGMRSPLAVFTLHHEINHHLVTLWLYLAGPGAPAGFYHLPSYLFGVAAIVVAALIGFRRSFATGVATAIVFACSYELVAYSTEARGYSAVTFAALMSFYSLERRRGGGSRWLLIYWLTALLGILAQPIFAGFLGAAIAFTACDAYLRTGTVSEAIREVFRVHALPVVALVLLWAIDLRLVVAGGGTPASSLTEVYAGALAWGIGTIDSPAPRLVCAAIAMALVGGALRARWHADRAEALFFLCAIVVCPVALVLVRGSELVYVRHFMIASLFVLLVLGVTIGRWWNEGRRAPAIVAIVAFVVVNGINVRTLAKDGRGQYQAAIRRVVQSTPGDTITIAGDQDFRIGTELAYYAPRPSAGRALEYFPQGRWPAAGPEWLVVQRESFDHATPVARLDLGPGHRFDWQASFPTAPLSGLHWYLYRRSATE